MVCYKNEEVHSLIEFDIHEYNIGLIMNSIPTFEADELKETLYEIKKLVYLFGNKHLHDIENSVVLMSDNEVMESISSTAFEFSETLGLGLTLANFNPEGEFESQKMIIEHYETLAHIFNMEMKLEEKTANPIRELSKMQNILQVAPFEKRLNTDGVIKLFSAKVEEYLDSKL